MASRLALHTVLQQIMDEHKNNVYYQPPSSVKMRYPAIRYERLDIDVRHANNSPYSAEVSYSVTVIDANPDSDIVMKIASLPKCRFQRHYTAENLNHDVFTLFY